MIKILFLIFISFNLLQAETVKSSVNYLNKTDSICKRYEIIKEIQRTNKKCVVDKPYLDVTIDTSITSEDPHMNDPQCIRLNNLKDSRYYKDITFKYKNYGFFNTIIKKVYLNEEEEDFVNEEEKDGFERIELNEYRTYSDITNNSTVPSVQPLEIEPALPVVDTSVCNTIDLTCVEYLDKLENDNNYIGSTRYIHPYNGTEKRMHVFMNLDASECRNKKELFGGTIIGKEKYTNKPDYNTYPNDRNNLEFKMNSNSKLDRFNHDYITKIPLENFDKINITRDTVLNEFSFNQGQSYKNESFVYKKRECKDNTGTFDETTGKCIYNANIKCEKIHPSAYYSAAEDNCKINTTIGSCGEILGITTTYNASTSTCDFEKQYKCEGYSKSFAEPETILDGNQCITESSCSDDYPHLITSGHPVEYGSVACGKKYYWYTYHCPIDNSVEFNLGDPEFLGIGPDFDKTGTDSNGYNYYSNNTDKRSGVEGIGNPIKSSGSEDCLGTCGPDGCICNSTEISEEPPAYNCKVWNESNDKTNFCVIEDNYNACLEGIETTQGNYEEYLVDYSNWEALPEDSSSKYIFNESGEKTESLEPDMSFKLTSQNQIMSLQECDQLAQCVGGESINHTEGSVCNILVGEQLEIDNTDPEIENHIEETFQPDLSSSWKEITSQFNGLEDIFSVEQVMQGKWGYYSNYLSRKPEENKVEVSGLQISPIIGKEITTIKDPINYSYAHQSRATTTKKPNFIAGALAGGATGLFLSSPQMMAMLGTNPVGWIILAVIVVFVLISALFGKEYKLRENHVNWELWKNRSDTYVYNPYNYDNRGLYGATGNAYNPVSVNSTEKINISKGSESELIPHYETQRTRWLRFTSIPSGNGLVLNRNGKDYLSYADSHYFTGTMKGETRLKELLNNNYNMKKQVFLDLGFEDSQIDRSSFETKTIPGFPKCKWYKPSCTKRNYAQESGTIPKPKDTNTVFLGATNNVSIVVPFSGDYIVKAYDKNDNELGVRLIKEDMWINGEGTPSYAMVMFGMEMELSSKLTELDSCRQNMMVEWGGGVSGIYYEEDDLFTEKTLDTCGKSDDNYVKDHAATYLLLSDVNMVKEFKVKLEKPLPFANRVVLVTLNEKEKREYRCFGDFPECGIEGENNEAPQEYLSNPELFTPTPNYEGSN